jgi:hypothetical protein
MAEKVIPIKKSREEFRAFVLRALPKDVTPREIKYWLGHRAELADLLRKVIKRKRLAREESYETGGGDYGRCTGEDLEVDRG